MTIAFDAECLQSYGQGPRPYEAIRTEVLPDAHSAPSSGLADTDSTK